jgi:hypothetical protein
LFVPCKYFMSSLILVVRAPGDKQTGLFCFNINDEAVSCFKTSTPKVNVLKLFSVLMAKRQNMQKCVSCQ